MTNLAQVIPLKIRQVGFQPDRRVLACLCDAEITAGKAIIGLGESGELLKRREGNYTEE